MKFTWTNDGSIYAEEVQFDRLTAHSTVTVLFGSGYHPRTSELQPTKSKPPTTTSIPSSLAASASGSTNIQITSPRPTKGAAGRRVLSSTYIVSLIWVMVVFEVLE